MTAAEPRDVAAIRRIAAVARRRSGEMMTNLPETQEWADGAMILGLASELEAVASKLAAVEGLIDAAQGSFLFGGAYDPGIVSVRNLCAAIGRPVPQPEPISDEDLAGALALIDAIRTTYSGQPGVSPPGLAETTLPD